MNEFKIKSLACSGVWFPTRENLKNSINELINEYNKFSHFDNLDTAYTVLYCHSKYEFLPDRIIQKALQLHKEGKKLRVFCIWRYNKREMKIALNHIWIK